MLCMLLRGCNGGWQVASLDAQLMYAIRAFVERAGLDGIGSGSRYLGGTWEA